MGAQSPYTYLGIFRLTPEHLTNKYTSVDFAICHVQLRVAVCCCVVDTRHVNTPKWESLRL